VPAISSEKLFNNSKAKIDAAITISGNASYISNHLCCLHQESVLGVLKKNDIHVCPPMSMTIYAAMISERKLHMNKRTC
jgi:hypothetical protein